MRAATRVTWGLHQDSKRPATAILAGRPGSESVEPGVNRDGAFLFLGDQAHGFVERRRDVVCPGFA